MATLIRIFIILTLCISTTLNAVDGGKPTSSAQPTSLSPTVTSDAAVNAGNAAYARRDFVTAAAQYASACDAGNASACGALGEMYLKGEGLGISGARAAGPLAKACDAGIAIYCGSLGVLYDSGNGVNVNKARAFALFNGACSRSDMASCYNLGRLNESGQGTALNVAQAASLYQKACTVGIADACSSIGTMYARGAHFNQNDTQALAFYKLACGKGGQSGCQLYTSLVDDRNKKVELAAAIASSQREASLVASGGRGLRACLKEERINSSYSRPSGCNSLGGGVCDNPLESYNKTIYSSWIESKNICLFTVKVSFIGTDQEPHTVTVYPGEKISTEFIKEILAVTRN